MENSKKTCLNCGIVNLEDALFCENCGTDLRNMTESNPALDNNCSADHTVPVNSNYGADNVAQAGNNYGADSYGTLPVVQPVPRKPIPKWVPVLIAETAALALCIYGITGIMSKGKSPERVAENYFVHISNGDWEESYSEMDVEDSEFINAKMYAKIQEQTVPGIITNYQVNEQTEIQTLNGISQEVYDLAEDLGLGEYLEEGEKSSSLEKVIQIDFRVKGDTENSKYLIPLNQTPEGWKVMATNYICKDYQIYVPIGANVSVDGITLGEEYLFSQEGEESYMDVYSIPQIFYGSHEIEITMEDMEDVAETIEISYGNSQYRQESMQIREEILDILIQKAGENMQQIYSAAMAGKNFQTIENLFTSDEEERKEIRESYEYLLSDLNEGNYLPTRITFQDISGRAETWDCLVNVSFGYAVDYRYKSWGDWENDTYRDERSWTFRFVKENEDWVQTNLGCETLYY